MAHQVASLRIEGIWAKKLWEVADAWSLQGGVPRGAI